MHACIMQDLALLSVYIPNYDIYTETHTHTHTTLGGMKLFPLSLSLSLLHPLHSLFSKLSYVPQLFMYVYV